MATTPRRDRRGVSLITTLLLVFLMMVAVIGAFTRTMAERRSAIDQTAQVDAFVLAQEGLERYLATRTTMPTTLPDSLEVTLTGGRAVVTLQRLRASSSDTTLVLVSRGENTTTNRYAANTSPAVRTVAQMLRWSTGTLNAPAQFTALSGFSKNGNSGTLSGIDACTTSPAPRPSIPGMAVPTVSTTNLAPDYSGPTGPIDGDPDNAAVALGTPGTGGSAKDAIDLDWAGIVGRTTITPDYYQKTSSPASGSFPTNAQIGGSNWPIVFVEGDKTLNNSDVPSPAGQGILIVTGNLTMNGNTAWNGIILVGGLLTSNGNNTVLGATYSGLNIKLGQTVPPQALGNGNKTFQYNSCHVASAMGRFGGWQRMSNAWVDNWPSY